MNFLIIGLRSGYHFERLQEEAEKRGHKVFGALSSQLYAKFIPGKKAIFGIRKLGVKLSEIDLIYTWTISYPRKWDWFVFLKWYVEKYGGKVVYSKYVNDATCANLSPVLNYWNELKKSVLLPRSLAFYSVNSIKKVLKFFDFPFIVKIYKEAMMSQGRGVFLVRSKEELRQIVEKYQKETRRFIAREYIPNNGDIRVFVVGYKAIAAMYRIPKEGEFRSNISQGGSAEPVDLEKNQQLKEIAEKVAKATGVEIAGVDIMLHKYTKTPYVLEVNPGPQFRGMETLTGVNVAEKIVKYFEKLVAQKKKTGFRLFK